MRTEYWVGRPLIKNMKYYRITRKKSIAVLLVAVLLITAMPVGVHAAPSNSSFSSATLLDTAIGDQFTISGLTSGESQWFYMYCDAGEWLYGALYSMSGDWDLELHDASNTRLTRSANDGSTMEYLGYTIPTSGYYYFRVKAFSISGTGSTCIFKPVLCNGTSGTSSTNSNYDRTDAKYYLQTYWDTVNPVYPDFHDLGGNCANFVSQALKYGGMAMRGGASSRDADSSWFCDTNIPASQFTNSNYSATWANASYFGRHWGNASNGYGYERGYECKYYIGQDVVDNFSAIKSSLKVGDVIEWTSMATTNRTHVLMVYEITSDDVILAANSSDTNSLSLYDYAFYNSKQMIMLIRIKSGS